MSNDPNTISPAEIQILKKCLNGSFWTHSAPAMLASVALLKYASSRGYKSNLFVNCGVVISSAITGRLIAAPRCLEMVINEVPDGTLARQVESVRSKRFSHKKKDALDNPELDSIDQLPEIDPDITARQPQSSSNALPSSAYSKQTYDDLRRRNRDDFVNSRRPSRSVVETPQPESQAPPGSAYSDSFPTVSTYSDPPSPYSDPPLISPSPADEEFKPQRRKRVNKYGDEIED